MVDTTIKNKVGTFFLDDAKELEAYENILNNPMCHILKKETILIKEKDQDFSDEGKLISSRERTRPQWLVEYAVEEMPKPKKKSK